jgi:polyisoprenoid-binding protein YceI
MLYRRSWMILSLAIVGGGCALDSQGRRAEPPAAAPIATATSAAMSGVQEMRTAVPTGGALRIGPENTAIRFVGSNLMSKQPGSFGAFDGRMELASDDPRDARLSIEIDMDSVSTRIPLLTKHLKRPDFFDVEHFPTARFVSRGIERSIEAGSTHVITGDLTLHGVTRTLAIPARFDVSADRVSLEASITVHQSEFGMEKAARKTDDAVPVTISAQLARR